MDNKTYAIGILSLGALVLLIANFIATPQALGEGGVVATGRDYQIVTARVASGGDGLYILDTKTNSIAVLTYDTQTRRMVPRAVTSAIAAFPGAVTPGAAGVTPGRVPARER